jgi:hypothetical protein
MSYLIDVGAREQRPLGDSRDVGAREQRLHAELSAVLRELRDLRNDTQERAILTVRHALVQHSPERISASFVFPARARRSSRPRRHSSIGEVALAPARTQTPDLLATALPCTRAPRCSQARARWCAQQDDLVDELALTLTALTLAPVFDRQRFRKSDAHQDQHCGRINPSMVHVSAVAFARSLWYTLGATKGAGCCCCCGGKRRSRSC